MSDRDFETLVRDHHRMVLAYLRSLLPVQAPVEDLAQDCFLVAHRRLGEIDPGRDAGRWLRGVARMKALEWWRTRRAQPLDDHALAQIESRYDGWFAEQADDEHHDALSALQTCLQRLGDLLRKAVESHYLAGRPLAEAAQLLGSTEVALKKRLQRAREELAVCIDRRLGRRSP